MPINAHPDYIAAEKKFALAQTPEDKLLAMEEMLSTMPKHKSAEKLRANLRTRYKKFQESLEKQKKSSSKGKQGIKKSDMQAVLVGKTNSGKSSLLNLLTNNNPKISSIQFQTKNPEIGMMSYASTQIQIIENPAINSPNYDRGLTNSADSVLIIATNLEDIQEIKSKIPLTKKQIVVFNKSDLLDSDQKRRLDATLKSKKYNYQIVSTKTEEGIEELKGKIFESFNKLRIYTKDPNRKKPEMTKPIILKPGSTVKDVAEKILHGFSKNVIQTKITGPSSKFAGQTVGLNHEVKDMDIVEFKTR